jgi:hypothetical protein
MGGVAAMGVPVPMLPPAPPGPQAALQQDGTIQTSAPLGSQLPPITLQQPGWPDLPPEATSSFQSVQPVTLSDGTRGWAGQPADPTASDGMQVWSPANQAGNR